MAKIALVLPGNTFHANQLLETIPLMDEQRYGLPVFRKYKIPALAIFQGLDLEMKPWLREEMQVPGSIEWGNAPFSHTLLPLFPGSFRDEMRTRLGTVPVTFFGEFYVPKGTQIPTDYTLVLAGNSVLYSAVAEFWSPRQGDIQVQPYPDDAHAIRFENKIGILLREEWFTPLLKAFFLFQRYPIGGTHPAGRDCLAELVAEISSIADDPSDRVVVTPLDLEAPWIGSRCGSLVWEILFAELDRRGLSDVFTPLSAHLERFAREAVSAARPHRELTKWSNWEVQLTHMSFLNSIQPESDKEVSLRMIATGSDIFAAWGIKIMERKNQVVLFGVDVHGIHVDIPISYSQSVIDIQLAAARALENKSSLQTELTRGIPTDYMTSLAQTMAHRNNW